MPFAVLRTLRRHPTAAACARAPRLPEPLGISNSRPSERRRRRPRRSTSRGRGSRRAAHSRRGTLALRLRRAADELPERLEVPAGTYESQKAKKQSRTRAAAPTRRRQRGRNRPRRWSTRVSAEHLADSVNGGHAIRVPEEVPGPDTRYAAARASPRGPTLERRLELPHVGEPAGSVGVEGITGPAEPPVVVVGGQLAVVPPLLGQQPADHGLVHAGDSVPRRGSRIAPRSWRGRGARRDSSLRGGGIPRSCARAGTPGSSMERTEEDGKHHHRHDRRIPGASVSTLSRPPRANGITYVDVPRLDTRRAKCAMLEARHFGVPGHRRGRAQRSRGLCVRGLDPRARPGNTVLVGPVRDQAELRVPATRVGPRLTLSARPRLTGARRGIDRAREGESHTASVAVGTFAARISRSPRLRGRSKSEAALGMRERQRIRSPAACGAAMPYR